MPGCWGMLGAVRTLGPITRIGAAGDKAANWVRQRRRSSGLGLRQVVLGEAGPALLPVFANASPLSPLVESRHPETAGLDLRDPYVLIWSTSATCERATDPAFVRLVERKAQFGSQPFLTAKSGGSSIGLVLSAIA